MKVSSVIFSTATVFLATRATASSDSAENVSDQLYKKGNLGAGKKWGKNKGCADPAGAVIGLLHCIEVEDAQCAVAAYDPEFLRIHNEKDTVPLDGEYRKQQYVVGYAKHHNYCCFALFAADGKVCCCTTIRERPVHMSTVSSNALLRQQ